MTHSTLTSPQVASSLLRYFRFEGLRLERSGAGSDAPCDVLLALDYDGNAGIPLLARLESARRRIRDEGVVLLALPNRFALRFWSGCPEPASGSLFATLSDSGTGPRGSFNGEPSPLYVSRHELAEGLADAGLVALEWFFAVPHSAGADESGTLFSEQLVTVAPTLAAGLASSRPSADKILPRLDLFPEALVGRALARSGLFAEFASHFLVAACSSSTSQGATGGGVWPRLRPPAAEIGWHFAAGRRIPVATVFQLDPDGGISVEKRRADGIEEPTAGPLTWHAIPRTSIAPGEPLSLVLQGHLVAGNSDAYLEAFADFHTAVRARFADGEGFTGQALDAILTNATRDGAGQFHLFDLEWSTATRLDTSWWILRNTLACSAMRGPMFAGVTTLAGLYERICRELAVAPRLETDLAREVELAATVSGSDSRDLAENLTAALAQTWPVAVTQGLNAAELRPNLELARAHQQLIAEYRRLEVWARDLAAQVEQHEAALRK